MSSRLVSFEWNFVMLDVVTNKGTSLAFEDEKDNEPPPNTDDEKVKFSIPL